MHLTHGTRDAGAGCSRCIVPISTVHFTGGHASARLALPADT